MFMHDFKQKKNLILQKLVDARIELHPALRAPRTRAKDLLFLDIALESCFRTAMEKRLISLNFSSPPVPFSLCSLKILVFRLFTPMSGDMN